ncbi:MAG: S9 family peptidase, partial [Erythrobacter sp.]
MIRAVFALAASFLATPAAASSGGAGPEPPTYPATRTESLVEVIFGEQVADPYRWLENDPRSDPAVARWVAQQNAATQDFVRQLPQREWFANRITDLMDFERFGLPRKAGESYFFTRNSGLLNQPQLYVQRGLDGERRLLLDPNAWSADGTAALAAWEPSPDGSLLAYSVQENGSDWRTIRVIDVASGRQLGEEIRWAKFTTIAWVGREGFLYSRFPEPAPGQDFRAVNYNQAVWFHRIGSTQAEDRLVFASPEHPERSHSARTTHDGRWAVITTALGMEDRHEIHLLDLSRRGSERWRPRQLVSGFANNWQLVEALSGQVLFITDDGAPRQRILAAELDRKKPRWREVVAETDQQISGASIVGQRLVVEYVRDAVTTAMVFDAVGQPVGRIALGALGAAGGFRGNPADPETFYSFTSFNRPASVYRLDLASGESNIFAAPELTFDPDRYEIEQRFYSSRDGTRVPIFIVRSKALAQSGKPAPTLLYGYGGFDISLTPGFSAARMAW